MSDENLVKQLADAMRADVNDGHWTGWEQTARAVLSCGLVVPTSDVLKKINDWDHGHVLPPRFVRELRALTQQEAR